jgi:transposase InsO family protein
VRPAWPSTWCGIASRLKPGARFLDNHIKNLVFVDFFTVPTIRFQVLYVFLVLAHDRRRLHLNVTAHPTAEWKAQQLREAFPFDRVPRYLLRDRDRIFGDTFRAQVNNLQIKEVLSAPRSPWQRAYVERVIGSLRRECLDHVIVFGESSLRRTLSSYFSYDHRTRPHLSLGKDAPEHRPIQPPELGPVVAVPQVGGLHHRYRTTRRLKGLGPIQLALGLRESSRVQVLCLPCALRFGSAGSCLRSLSAATPLPGFCRRKKRENGICGSQNRSYWHRFRCGVRRPTWI